MEIYQSHLYFVGSNHILVHNICVNLKNRNLKIEINNLERAIHKGRVEMKYNPSFSGLWEDDTPKKFVVDRNGNFITLSVKREAELPPSEIGNYSHASLVRGEDVLTAGWVFKNNNLITIPSPL